MHIPENYLSPSTCGAFTVAMVPIWATAIRHVSREVPRQKMPLVGVAAAFCFLAMMFNIPLPGGTTGHAVGGTLVAILFGPWAATLAISIALAIQAVLFGDGGVLALPANCFNMAFVLPMCGYAVYSLVRSRCTGREGRDLLAAGLGAYVGINAAALCAAIEFGVQPLLFHDAAGRALYCPYPLGVSVPAMLAGHLTIWGAAEVVFTVGVLAFVRRTAPDFGLSRLGVPRAGSAGSEASGTAPLGAGASPATSGSPTTAAASSKAPRAVLALMACLVVLTPIGLVATGDAWGEWSTSDLAARVGYTPSGMASGWEWRSLLPDYSVGALPDWLGYVLSAVIGVTLLIIVFRLLAGTSRAKADFGPRPQHD